MTFSQITMQIYLVGGAVRDTLLKRPVTERDWVVVGATPEQMVSLGYTQVGKDFPVFLHPKTKEEYALARTERKAGKGYTGFTVDASPHVTLEEDLLRRDLTVNAMAMDDNGKIIDPYHGQRDLEAKTLRHVSDAFCEDPLRVLRVARFAARYAYLGFTVAPETIALMGSIAASGELTCLTPERVWKELSSSLAEQHPDVFLSTLKACDALQVIWPEIDNIWMADQGACAQHTLKRATLLSGKTTIRFASLALALNAPSEVNTYCERFKVPNEFKTLAVKTATYAKTCENAFSATEQDILEMFNRLDIWRKPEEFEDFLVTCEAGFGTGETPLPQATFLRQAASECKKVDAKQFIDQGLQGKAIKEAMDEQRIAVINSTRTAFSLHL